MPKLRGKEKELVAPFLDTLAKYGCGGIQMGSKTYKKEGKNVIESAKRKKRNDKAR